MFGEEMDRVFEDMYYEAGWVGYAVGLSHLGQRSAKKDVSVTTDYTDQVPWGGWTPGDPDAAKQLIGDVNAPGLKNLLDNRYVTIKGIEQTRYTELANILARGAERGDSMATVSTAIDRWLENLPNDPDNPTPQELVRLGTSNPWNEMVARTEIRSATTAASLDSYREGGLQYVEWLTADGGCDICAEYEDMGPVLLEQGFGDIDGPPAHPNCLCVILPVVGDFAEEASLLELTEEQFDEVLATADELGMEDVDPNASKPGYIAITDDMQDWEKELVQGANDLALTAEQLEAQKTQEAVQNIDTAMKQLKDAYPNEYESLNPLGQFQMAQYLADGNGVYAGDTSALNTLYYKTMLNEWQDKARPTFTSVPTTTVREEEIREFAERMFAAHENNRTWKDADQVTLTQGSEYITEVRQNMRDYTESNIQRYLDKPAVQEALSHAPTYEAPVFRGINVGSSEIGQFKQLQEGDIFPNKDNSASFSTKENVARKFANTDYRPETAIIVHMDSITGISVAPFSKYDWEYEIVTNSIFRVQKLETQADGVLHIYAKEVRE